ncbi:Pyruvate [Abeliophyllum distichum]|uniref:Pyruvate n=1 Tax=Abeliophyllum distichum TaxID=126358 RepID=A0ABD1VB68_9LAMI
MSSTVKGVLVRSAANAVHTRKLLKEKYGYADQIDHLFRANPSSIRVSRWSGQVGVIRSQANKFSNSNPKPKREPNILSQAILTPVSDPTSTTKKRVFTFGKGRSEGNKGMKSLLGGKGANLAEMASIGLSVPPGLTISTEACQEYQQIGKKLPQGLWEEILEGLRIVEDDMGAFLGDPSKPLLLSVRSGAAISMPGMMDTVLNLGLNDEVVGGLAAKSGERFAYDSFRRFLDMFGDVVMGIPHSLFEEKLENMKNEKGINLDTDLTASDLKELVEQYKDVYVEAKGEKFPSDPKKQLELAVKAVFDSWDCPRAIKYRSINHITGLKGTAVNIQCMSIKLSLMVLLLGVGIATITDLQLNILGSILSLLAVVTTCIAQIMTNTIQKKFKVSSTQLLYQSCPYQAMTLLISGPFLDRLLTNQNVFSFNYTPKLVLKDTESDSLLHDETGTGTLNDVDVPKAPAWKSDKDLHA